MRPVSLSPDLHVLVCANRRSPDSPLGRGCGDAGEQVYSALKAEVARRGEYRRVWITETKCLGICPKTGCTITVYPGARVFAEVEPPDALALFGNLVGALS